MNRLRRPSILAAMLISLLTVTASAGQWQKLRGQMMQAIEQDVRLTANYIGFTSLNKRVLEAIGEVPRHQFVPTSQIPLAYLNRPLPIGHGQTISQPYIVALMTHLLETQEDHRVLEVGTGSAYQAAVLSRLVKKVYSMEIIDALATQARQRLHKLGYDNVETRLADGYYGWPEAAPFDSIIVTAAGSRIPPPLLDQLKPGGRMVLPVGDLFSVQHLILVEKAADGTLTTRQILPVRFVPLTGDHR